MVKLNTHTLRGVKLRLAGTTWVEFKRDISCFPVPASQPTCVKLGSASRKSFTFLRCDDDTDHETNQRVCVNLASEFHRTVAGSVVYVEMPRGS